MKKIRKLRLRRETLTLMEIEASRLEKAAGALPCSLDCIYAPYLSYCCESLGAQQICPL